jgi:hypothetical protein
MILVAEREGFEPPIGLHLCRISSAVHSTTLPPLQAQIRANQPLRSGRVLECFQAKWKPVRAKKTRPNKSAEPGSDSIRTGQAQRKTGEKVWDRQTRKKPAVPCRLIEIAGREVRLRQTHVSDNGTLAIPQAAATRCRF